jgi:glycosyltransferase involved in cell wall biosynthesis
MAAALPMVVTRVGGNPELVTHWQRGVVVEPGQPQALGQVLGFLAQNAVLCRRLGAAGRAHVARALTLTRMVAAHDALYRRLATH